MCFMNKSPKEYEKFFFRLSGFEGHNWKDLRVSGYGKSKKRLRRIPLATKETVHYIVEVKGFIDEHAKVRDW